MSVAAASTRVDFVLNGQPVGVEVESTQATLLDFLRDRGLTGAKEGCAEGECGACTVVVVTDANGRSEYRPVNSCLMFLPMAAGHEILSIEALAAGGRLAEAQAAMAAAGGSQCGYCTPGFVMSLFAEHYRPDRSGPIDPTAMAGNLCRCTGYRPIRDAAQALGPAPADDFRDRLSRPAPVLGAVSIDGFSRPATLDACVALLAADPSATLIAGATDLAVDANLRRRRWPHLVSLDAIAELHEVVEVPSAVRIGAAVPLSDLAHRWRTAPPVIEEWLDLFASPPIRHRATLGGNLATASPIGDSAPLLLALDAIVHVMGGNGRRSLPISEFFTGYRKTALHPGELIESVEIPTPVSQSIRFFKVAKRRLDDISTVAAAMAVDCDSAGRVRRARFAFGGMAATPVPLTDIEGGIAGQPWTMEAVERVQQRIERSLNPRSDHRGSREYRLQVAQRLVEKFWWEGRR